jgi:hypothetical protein
MVHSLLVLAAAGLAVAAFAGCSTDGDVGSARRAELAPIESAELVARESFPVAYAVHVTSGLPSGCAVFDRIDVERAGDVVALTVWNTLPADPEVACTMIYGMTSNTAEIGSDFMPGRTYTVRINDTYSLSFDTE